MFKILIVEDSADTLDQLRDMLVNEIPEAKVDAVLTQDDSMELIRRAALQKKPYDIVFLDFKLPICSGEEPEVNQMVYDELRNHMKETIVIHTTAYPHDPVHMERVLAEAKQSPLNPRSVFLSKSDHNWAEDLLKVVKEINTKRAEEGSNIQKSSEDASLAAHSKFQSCFISYSHVDEEFVKKLYSRLSNEGMQLWYAAVHMLPERKIHEEIEINVRIFDKLLLVLSETSLKSDWVATEIRAAIDEERTSGKRKLFPIRLVDYERIRHWQSFNSDIGKDTAVELREYYIPDFRNWKDPLQFERAVRKLVKSLRI